MKKPKNEIPSVIWKVCKCETNVSYGAFQFCDSVCLGLQKLLLHNNQLFQLPDKLDSLVKLQLLTLEGNPMTYPPVEVFSQGLPAIWTYLQEERKEKTLAISVRDDKNKKTDTRETCSMLYGIFDDTFWVAHIKGL